MDKHRKSWLFPGSANRDRATPPAKASQDDVAEHGPIEEWFVRTKRHLLQSSRNLFERGAAKPSPLQERIAALEADNARLRADSQRLTEEIAALRTLVKPDRERSGN